MSGDTIHTMAMAEFYHGHQPNELKSKEAGRPIHDDVIMCRVYWAGNTKSELHEAAHMRSDRYLLNPDKSKTWLKWSEAFPTEWEKFQKGEAQAASGTPLSELPFLTQARRAELKAVNILTAEQLAKLGDEALKKLGMGMGDLKRQAQAFLDRAAGAAVDARHEEERAGMQRQMDELRAQLAELQSLGATPKQAAKAAPKAPAAASPFESWADDDLRAWLKDADPSQPAPGPRTGHAKLVELCDATNKRLADAKTPVAA